MKPAEGEWLETMPEERFKIQTSSSDTGGAYLIFEVEAAPRIGVPLHTHDHEEEHFIVVEGTIQIAVGGKTQDAGLPSWYFCQRQQGHSPCMVQSNRLDRPLYCHLYAWTHRRDVSSNCREAGR
jgi:hypothetical protein